jgi:hypothetical protein
MYKSNFFKKSEIIAVMLEHPLSHHEEQDKWEYMTKERNLLYT